MLSEFYMVAFREKLDSSIEKLQRDLHAWMREYNGEARPHQGRWCDSKTPLATC